LAGDFAAPCAAGDYAAAVTGPLGACAQPADVVGLPAGDSRAELRERIGTTSPLRRFPLAVRAWMSQQDSKRAGHTCAGAWLRFAGPARG